MSRPQKKLSNTEQIIAGFSHKTRKHLADCALEGLYPNETTLLELQLLDSGQMTPQEFKNYITVKYRQASNNK